MPNRDGKGPRKQGQGRGQGQGQGCRRGQGQGRGNCLRKRDGSCKQVVQPTPDIKED